MTFKKLRKKLDDYQGASGAELQAAITSLPSSNPNFYYERLSPSSGLTVPATSQTIPSTGDGTTIVLVGERTSVGGIRPDIPFESLWQGQIEIGAATAGTVEIEATFQHFYKHP